MIQQMYSLHLKAELVYVWLQRNTTVSSVFGILNIETLKWTVNSKTLSLRDLSPVYHGPNITAESGLTIRSKSPNAIGLTLNITYPESVVSQSSSGLLKPISLAPSGFPSIMGRMNSRRIRSKNAENAKQKSPSFNAPPRDGEDTTQQSDLPTAGRNRVRKWFKLAGNSLTSDAAHEHLRLEYSYDDEFTKNFSEMSGKISYGSRPEICNTSRKRLGERKNSEYVASIVSTSGLESNSSSPPSPSVFRSDAFEVPREVHIRN